MTIHTCPTCDQPISAPMLTSRIAYDRASRDYAVYVGINGAEQFLGYAATRDTAEQTAEQYRFEYLRDWRLGRKGSEQ
jgi:hypothetical protein